MSEGIRESIPTSADARSRRPLKKRALTPVSQAAEQVEALFARPDQEIRLPQSSGSLSLADQQSGTVPQIIASVQGSSAGAGSGEFHVYKASRRREYERLKKMDEEVEKEKDGEAFDRERKEREERDLEKTRKNREKREKKMKRRKGGAGASTAGNTAAGGIQARSVGAPRAADDDGTDERMADQQPSGLIIHDDD